MSEGLQLLVPTSVAYIYCTGSVRYVPSQEGEFDWDEQTQGLVLGAFYYGYTLTNLVGGRASEHFGGRLVFGLGAATSSFISLLSPLCARTSTGLFIASRVLMGLSQVRIKIKFSLNVFF